MRRGRLSKVHLANPQNGLDIELKKAQEEPIEVMLTLVGSTDLEKVDETALKDRSEDVENCE